MPLRLLVVDGGDRGQAFPLPAAGVIRIGNYGGHTDICLHDLYVAKDHCHVEVAADGTRAPAGHRAMCDFPKKPFFPDCRNHR